MKSKVKNSASAVNMAFRKMNTMRSAVTKFFEDNDISRAEEAPQKTKMEQRQRLFTPVYVEVMQKKGGEGSKGLLIGAVDRGLEESGTGYVRGVITLERNSAESEDGAGPGSDSKSSTS